MIDRLSGTLVAKIGDSVVIDVGGVGFALDVSAITMRELPFVGADVTLHTHLNVREDALQLFGFSTEDERTMFRLFLGVSKIGPRLALAACSCRRAPDLRRALAAGDVALFASVPGIGKKTAERLILELREKVGDLVSGSVSGASPGPDGDSPLAVARAALMELGFAPQEADQLLAPLDAEQSAEELIRRALAKRYD